MCGEMLSVKWWWTCTPSFPVHSFSAPISSSKALLCITLCSLTLSRRFISDTFCYRGKRYTPGVVGRHIISFFCSRQLPKYRTATGIHTTQHPTSYYCTFCVCFFSFDKGKKRVEKGTHKRIRNDENVEGDPGKGKKV